MGREIRRVPPNWNHPKNNRGHLVPMYDRTFDDAAREWKSEFAKWESEAQPVEFWEDYGNPPAREECRPWEDEEATWFQLWETVTEGTPMSPPFATLEALADHLAVHGDDWEHTPWGHAAAHAFVKEGWAPSLAIVDGEIIESRDIPLRLGGAG